MKILALDIASKTGWSVVDNGRLIESGVQDFTKRRGESNGMMFIRFRHWLNSMYDLWGFNLACYELAHYRGGAATEICVNLTGRVQEVCEEKHVNFIGCHTATLKKWACGHGKADKDRMMARAVTYLGRAPLDDNEADAVLLGMWAHEETA